jgi:hypothetical protein
VKYRIRYWISSLARIAVVLTLVACGEPSGGPPASAVVHVHEKFAEPYGNTLKDVRVEHLTCTPVGTAWGCSYDIRGTEVFSRGRGEKAFDRKGLTIKLERRGNLWDLAI